MVPFILTPFLAGIFITLFVALCRLRKGQKPKPKTNQVAVIDWEAENRMDMQRHEQRLHVLASQSFNYDHVLQLDALFSQFKKIYKKTDGFAEAVNRIDEAIVRIRKVVNRSVVITQDFRYSAE